MSILLDGILGRASAVFAKRRLIIARIRLRSLSRSEIIATASRRETCAFEQ